jgi:hypothetical protein
MCYYLQLFFFYHIIDGMERNPQTDAIGKARASKDRQSKPTKITTKRVLRSASKASSEPPTSTDDDSMQGEQRINLYNPHLILHLLMPNVVVQL